jgi:hypothetical protein
MLAIVAKLMDKGEDLSPEEEVSTSRRVLAFNVARSLLAVASGCESQLA